MRLAAFIRTNSEHIAAQWELFAATLLPDVEFSKLILRNGIIDMMAEIAADMDTNQTDEEQQGKSEGDPRTEQLKEAVAERHALARIKMGLSVRQLISEFRALRATVIRLWHQNTTALDTLSLYDLTRFNEAVDQALTEAAVRYSDELDRSRELFLAILGHDLRNPLTAISGLAELIQHTKSTARHTGFAVRILASAGRMSHMITDLIELARVRLGAGIAINPVPTGLRRICANALDEMKAGYPDRIFQLDCKDAIPGVWDEARMDQVLSNLLGNAVKHGAIDAPIIVTARQSSTGAEIVVHNQGVPIAPDHIPKLFDFLFQGAPVQREAADESTSLGLGLYITKEIITAHGGTIDVRSTATEGTTFTIRIPSSTAVSQTGGHPTPPPPPEAATLRPATATEPGTGAAPAPSSSTKARRAH